VTSPPVTFAAVWSLAQRLANLNVRSRGRLRLKPKPNGQNRPLYNYDDFELARQTLVALEGARLAGLPATDPPMSEIPRKSRAITLQRTNISGICIRHRYSPRAAATDMQPWHRWMPSAQGGHGSSIRTPRSAAAENIKASKVIHSKQCQPSFPKVKIYNFKPCVAMLDTR